jgi:hypothetical protein
MAAAKAYVRPRPIRVAYLVEEHEHWKLMLDAIFAEAYGRWGGRFSLIVPCEGAEIRAAYLPWLDIYDPDIIYSYVDLDDAVVERIHERFCPAFLVRHDFHRRQERDLHAYRPGLPVTPLSVLSIAGVMTRGDMLSAPRPLTIVDTNYGTPPTQFLQENFGCYNRSSVGSWPIGKDMQAFLKAVVFVPPEIQANSQIVPRAEGEIVSSEQELIDRLASQRDLVGLAQLSACLAPRLEFDEMAWSHTVNFVVGDSFADRLAFWNGLHHTPVWQQGNIVALKVAEADLNDPVRFQSIVSLIKARVYLPLGGNVSHSQIVVRSASVPQAVLDQIASRLKAVHPFNAYTAEHLPSIDALVPSARALEHARQHVEPGSPFQAGDWHEFSYGDQGFRPTTVLPRHLRDMSQLPANVKQGLWQLDLDMERTVDYSPIQNVQHHWRLPRRLRMTGAFTRGYQLHGFSPFCMPRTTGGGLISLTCGVEGTPPEITVPADEAAFRYALCAPRDWWPFVRGPQKRAKPGPVLAIRPSDKGRYLTALLRMSGGIFRAKEIFLSQFWKEQFEALGATPKATEDRIASVTGRLRNRFRGGQISTETDWHRLALTVLAEAHAERFPLRYLRFDDLTEKFERFREAYWTQHHPGATRDAEWEEHERRSLAVSVSHLCRQEILHQGHEWRCPQCFNNNWVSLDELKRTMACEVCGRTRPAPVAAPWHFRLNAFVSEGMREHGLLPDVWCLAKCADRATTSFLFLEPHELFYTERSADKGKPDSEIDLLIVADGFVRLCEAKSSRQGINIDKLACVAKRIRPDLVTLAVMEPTSPALTHRLTQLQQALADCNITADLMTLDDQDIDRSPVLPAGNSFRVRVL